MIDMKGVTVRYGSLTALNNFTLELPAGEVYGFIGPNGAGKSTTMKVLACLLRADSGRAHVDGMDVRTHSFPIRRIIGYMPDFLGVYDDLTVDEYLQFFASAFEIPRKKRRAIVDGVLELTDLTEKRDSMVDGLSRGMQQRLGVARVLIHDPKVLLLDEPASGLDPRARIEMRSLLTELRSMGKTIIVSSHILSELHEMCTSIGIIERGTLLFSGSLDDAFKQAGVGERIAIRLEGDPDNAERVLRSIDLVDSVRKENGDMVVDLVAGTLGHHDLIERLVRSNVRIDAFRPISTKLEDVFLRITQGKVQ
ncbi:MAG: ABC transporter ATP-binding protein [Phycisphaeraceae bacterium]|nr:ABC transporter ATP-binding protein [Phycisphaerales bacterium]MCB9842461.1 ABC transporter ATP-binding protein [Phycisphaeraceae bacterium]